MPIKKILWPILIFLAALALLAGLIPFFLNEMPDRRSVVKRKDITEPVDEQPKQINWLSIWKGEENKEEFLNTVKRNFEFQNPGIRINLKTLTRDEERDFNTRAIIDMVRTGNITWDIVVVHPPNYVTIAEELNDPGWVKKHCVDFEKVPGFVQTQKPFIIDNPLYRRQVGGILPGPHVEGFYWALYYNAAVAEKIGLEIPAEDMTFSDLLRCVKAVNKYNKENGTAIAPFYESNDWCTLYILFQRLFDSQITDFSEVQEETASERKNAALLKTLQAFEELGKYKPLAPESSLGKWSDTYSDILFDKALFLVNGTWMFTYWEPVDKERTGNMVPVELPSLGECGHYLGGYKTIWGVMKNSANRGLAVKFLMSFTLPKIAERWVRITKSPTGISGNISQANSGNDQFERFQYMIDEKYGGQLFYPETTGYILGKENNDLRGVIEANLRKLLNGKISARAAYAKIMAKTINKNLKLTTKAQRHKKD